MTHADSSIGEADSGDRAVSGEVGMVHGSNLERPLDEREVVRFESHSAYQFRWAEELRCDTGVYVRRWRIETPIGSVRIHHWLHSDDMRFKHDHPWWFITLVLWGGYQDCGDDKVDHLRAGSIRFRPANHRHSVWVDEGVAWTLLVTGPKVRKWGFWVKGKLKKANKFFLEHGVHVCN